MRALLLAVSLLIFSMLAASLAFAYHPRVEALGNATLVIEDETTTLTLFNQGNPAAATFLPSHNRWDLLLQIEEQIRETEFTTLPPEIQTTSDGKTIVTYGHYVDPYGNTLLTHATYAWRSQSLQAAFNDWQDTYYGGWLIWLDPNLVLQFIPQANYRVSSADDAKGYFGYSGQGSWKLAWQGTKDLAVGGAFGFKQAEQELKSYQFSDIFLRTFLPLTVFDLRSVENQLQAELGVAYRPQAIFDDADQLDVGLMLQGIQKKLHYQYFSDSSDRTVFDDSTEVGSTWQTQMPWRLKLQTIYHYQTRMDIGFFLDYEAEKQFLSWPATALLPEQESFMLSDLKNLSYQVDFRVRLPMVREDDLRFGVMFNNHPVAHPYPTGYLQLIDPATQIEQPLINTASSAIGIGMAFVPEEESLVVLDYRIGSSKSRQQREILADSGYTSFVFGVQYRLLTGLFLRLAFTNQRLSFQSKENQIIIDEDNNKELAAVTLTQVEETNSFHFGLGMYDGPFRIDLATQIASVKYSPEGWDLWNKPIDLKDMNKDSDLRLSGMLSLTWLY